MIHVYPNWVYLRVDEKSLMTDYERDFVSFITIIYKRVRPYDLQ